MGRMLAPSLPGFNSRAHGGRDMASPSGTEATTGFNSRAHGGRDSMATVVACAADAFQFTRPRGARHGTPRVHVLVPRVSIHAPTGGATKPPSQPPPPLYSFNSRAHGGRDEDLP